MKLRMERDGQFAVNNFEENPSKCGQLGMTIFRYRVEIEGNSKHLDGKGFIIDNNDIQKYFDSTYTAAQKQSFVSCENMAAKAVRDLRQKFFSSAVKIYGIKVTIWGSQQASLTAYWSGNMLPAQHA